MKIVCKYHKDSNTITLHFPDKFDAANLANASVTTDILANASVTTLKIVDAAVEAVKLATASITSEKVATAAIGSNHLQDALVTTAKIANLAVNTSRLADLTITAGKLASSCIEASKIANLAVGAAAIASGAIGTAKIADAAILEAKIDNVAITSAKIADLAVTEAKIDALAVTNAKIGNIDANKITTGYLTADRIAAGSITADRFVSTLYGDLNQAMDYVKNVLGAGDEYSYDLTDTDLSNGLYSTIDADTHYDYGVSIRIATAVEWDDGGAVWDTGTWDEPTDASGYWTSASMDLGSSKTLQMALRYTIVEETPASTTPTITAIYSSDNINWGTNAALNDSIWETLTQAHITGDIYKASGTLKTLRYFKIKITLATTVTTDRIILHALTYLGNVINLFGQEVNKTIAAGGTAISLSGFNTTPAITVTPVGATLLIPKITAQSSSSVTIKLYNLAGADVGGNANVTIIGV